LLEFAEEILALTGNKVKIVHRPLPVDDPKQRQPDIKRARKLLGWEPKVTRAEGLRITYDYFRSLPQEEWSRQPKEFVSQK
jgi:dTDP-glucose 4,6-dehydratase